MMAPGYTLSLFIESKAGDGKLEYWGVCCFVGVTTFILFYIAIGFFPPLIRLAS